MPYLILDTGGKQEVKASGSAGRCQQEGARLWAAGETGHMVVVLETGQTFGGDYKARVASRQKSLDAQASISEAKAKANAALRAKALADAAAKIRAQAEAAAARADEAEARAAAEAAKASKTPAKKATKKKAVSKTS